MGQPPVTIASVPPLSNPCEEDTGRAMRGYEGKLTCIEQVACPPCAPEWSLHHPHEILFPTPRYTLQLLATRNRSHILRSMFFMFNS